MSNKKNILTEINRVREIMYAKELYEQNLDEQSFSDLEWRNPFKKKTYTDIAKYWDKNIDLSWEGINNLDDYWLHKDVVDVSDFIDDIVDEASDALSDFVDNAEEVAREFADYLVDTTESLSDWVSDLGTGIYNVSSDIANWIKKQADSVIWYWTRGPGGKFFKCLGDGFTEIKDLCVSAANDDVEKYVRKFERRVSRALAKGDTEYLDDLSAAIKCGIGLAIAALTIVSLGLFGIWGTVTLASIATIGWYKYLATNSTKVRVGYPQEDWEYFVFEQLKDFGIVNGIFRNLEESKKWWDAYPTSPKLKHLFIGSHGSAGKIITLESGKVQLFSEEFLGPIKPHVDKNTKVFFTACHGADDLVALKKASEYLGCDCYGCEGVGWGGAGCEYDAYKCKAGDPLLKNMKKSPLPSDWVSDLTFLEPGCYPENTDNIQSIQKFLVDKGIDIGTSGGNKDGVDGAVGNSTANGIAEYLKYPQDVNSVKSLKSYLKNDLGYKTILRGNNPGTWGPDTNNLISYLIATKCSSKGSDKTALYTSNEAVKRTKGCIVVNQENWWLGYS